jgi:recombination protein RecA
MGITHEVVQKSGAWFAYGDERLGQGRENAKQFLKENDEVRGRILADIYEKLGLGAQPDVSTDGLEDTAEREDIQEPAEEPAGRFA